MRPAILPQVREVMTVVGGLLRAVDKLSFAYEQVASGMVETDFSLVRFEGDQERADKVYEGLTPLVAEDVAEVIGFVASRPPHVNLDQIILKPRDQASARRNIKTG